MNTSNIKINRSQIVIDTSILENWHLSLAAKGLYAWSLCQDLDFDYTPENLAKHINEEIAVLAKLVHELINVGLFLNTEE